MKWTKNRFTGDWESSDGRWEISPRGEIGVKGGTTRANYWHAKDRTGRVSSYAVRYLADAKSWCVTIGSK